MVKNKVRTPAQAKGKRLTLPGQRYPKVNPNEADATYSTLSLATTPHVVNGPSFSTAHTPHNPHSLTPSQTASSLTMPSSLTQDTNPSPTQVGSPSSCATELPTPPVQSASTCSTVPAAATATTTATEAQPTPDDQQSPQSGWERCSSGDAPSQWGAVPDRVYVHAAAIFDHAREEIPGGLGVIRYGPRSESPPCPPPASTAQEQHQAYQLAFNTLKYQELLENVFIDSCLCRAQTLPDDLMALAMVMLFELMDRKFLPREPIDEGGPLGEVRQVDVCLLRFKTKLAASLARLRIKSSLLTVADSLPETVRMKDERARSLRVHAWVNTLKSSVEDVCEQLCAVGFSQVGSSTCGAGSVFWKDPHCSNVLGFPSHAKAQLMNSLLGKECVLNIQDKSRCLAACAACPWLVKDSEVLMVGSFSPLTVAHIGVQASARSARVVVCGLDPSTSQWNELQMLMAIVGCSKNVKVLSESFLELDEWDSRVQKVRVLLLLPQCSTSALCNPVEHIVYEDGDRSLLHCLSQGAVPQHKLDMLTRNQSRDLSHALSFPKVHAVVYCTCSEKAEENEDLVQRVLEKTETPPKLIPFRLVPPGLGCGPDQTSLKLEPSDFTNGCFLCVLAREPDPSKVESAQDVLARAAAKGLLEGLLAPLPIHKEKRRQRTRALLMSPPPVILEPVDLPSPCSPPSPRSASAALGGDDPEKVAVSSLEALQNTESVAMEARRKKRQRSKAARHQRSHKKHGRKRGKGPVKHKTSRRLSVLMAEREGQEPRQEMLLSETELVASKQEVIKPDQEACLKNIVISRHEILESKQDVFSSKDQLASVPDVLNFKQTTTDRPGSRQVPSMRHSNKSRDSLLPLGLRVQLSRQEEQRSGQERALMLSRHRMVKLTSEPETGLALKKEGRSIQTSRGQEAVRPVELVLPPLCHSQPRLSPSMSRLLSSSSHFSNTNSSITSRSSSAQ